MTSVLDRLSEEGLRKTRLAGAWADLAGLDDDEKAFCAAAARLGLDPLDVPDGLATDIVETAGLLADAIVGDFFDTADPRKVIQAARWTRKASGVAARASIRAVADLSGLRRAAATPRSMSGSARAWDTGYALARNVRSVLQAADDAPFDISPWLGIGSVGDDSCGVQGLAVVDDHRCGLVLGERRLSKPNRVFWQARALGRALVQPDQSTFLLSAAASYDERVARAFAAELLSPASGIRKVLDSVGRDDEVAFEAVAERFGVSPVVVRHQYDNQLARATFT